jgi:hypothetical protein
MPDDAYEGFSVSWATLFRTFDVADDGIEFFNRKAAKLVTLAPRCQHGPLSLARFTS